MLYGIEACPVMSRHKHSFDFTVTRVFMKILHTTSEVVVEECLRYFGFLPVSHRIVKRTARFLDRFISSDNMLCTLFKEEAQRHKNILWTLLSLLSLFCYQLFAITFCCHLTNKVAYIFCLDSCEVYARGRRRSGCVVVKWLVVWRAGTEPVVTVQHTADRLLGDEQGPQWQVSLPLLHACRAVRQTPGSSTRRLRPSLQLDLHLHRLHWRLIDSLTDWLID